ncbi:MAG: hypothetical protein GY719_15725 [bacterium]|nr:hypothetical protein [bacterium]
MPPGRCISRSTGGVPFPAGFALATATNPCPCGDCGIPRHECRSSLLLVRAHSRREIP